MSIADPTRIPIVDPPPDARLYAQHRLPLLGDCAPSGRIRLDALARWVQDIANADMSESGLQTAVFWVVRRTRILVKRFPRFGERLVVETFASGLARMCAERRTIVREPVEGDQEGAGQRAGAGPISPLVEAVTLWIHLDPVRLLPSPLRPGVFATYGATAGERKFSHRLMHPRVPQDVEQEQEWVFRRSDLDIAGHVNNAAYWEAIEEQLLALDLDPDAVDAEVEYRLPAHPGPVRVQRGHGYSWLTDPETGELYASLRVSDPDGAPL